MASRFSIAAGVFLLGLGSALALFNMAAEWAGLEATVWRLWPVSPAALGLLCLIPPLFTPRRRGLAALYLPGLSLLTVSALGMIGQVSPSAWASLWPLLILSLALALFLLERALQSVWLIMPAAIVGALGGGLLLTSLSGAWWLWAGLWTLMPLSAGLTLLAIGTQRRQTGLLMAGIFVAVASIGAGMSILALVSSHFGGAVVTMGGCLAIVGMVMVGQSLLSGRAQAVS